MSARIPEGSRSHQASPAPKNTGKVDPSRGLVEGSDQTVEATQWLAENCDNVLRGMMSKRELNQKSISEDLGPKEEHAARKSAKCLAANLKMCGEDWLSYQQHIGGVQTAAPSA